MGWNADNRFFAFGNGLFYENNWFEVNELGLVSCGGKTFYLPACSDMHRNDKGMFGFELDFIHKPDSTITLREYVAKLIQVFGDNAMVGFAFLVASLFRDVIYPVKDSFPILNLFGPPNSGKTALGTSLMAFSPLFPNHRKFTTLPCRRLTRCFRGWLMPLKYSTSIRTMCLCA